jgi:hypothetical protein
MIIAGGNMNLKYCCEKDDSQSDGHCPNIALSRKLFCKDHYIKDLETKLEWARDKIYDYEKQVVPELQEVLKKITSEVGTSTLAWKLANDVLSRHS